MEKAGRPGIHPREFSGDESSLSLRNSANCLVCTCIYSRHALNLGRLRLVGSLKFHVSFAKEPYKRDYLLQKRPIIIDLFSPHICCRGTGWRRCIGCLKVQVIFCKRATNYRALLRNMTCEDKASYDSTPPCRGRWILHAESLFFIYAHIYV